jgi:hypothetical protein
VKPLHKNAMNPLVGWGLKHEVLVIGKFNLKFPSTHCWKVYSHRPIYYRFTNLSQRTGLGKTT